MVSIRGRYDEVELNWIFHELCCFWIGPRRELYVGLGSQPYRGAQLPARHLPGDTGGLAASQGDRPLWENRHHEALPTSCEPHP